MGLNHIKRVNREVEIIGYSVGYRISVITGDLVKKELKLVLHNIPQV